ncbi:potassium-transporting ATPase subunit C, partial [Faecalibaculum rodentium]|uniref:potassium-transporting ATPase subunit C n=1 Tax=Faecalibaculum rodentium TaxID=1702221 RepID=UPI0026F40214
VVGVPANSDTGSPEYQAQKAQRMQQIAAANPDAAGPVPEELVTYAGSGNDPDLSLDAALWQVPRIAAARDMDEAAVEEIIRENVNPTVFSDKTVSVIRVNLALDGQE